MNVAHAWKDVLSQPQEQDHIVQMYETDDFLVKAVCYYLGKSLNRNEASIVIATPAHWKLFERRLIENDFDIERALASKQLHLFDAHETLATFMVDSMPDWNRFSATIGDIVTAKW
jgi:hypothetical protein